MKALQKSQAAPGLWLVEAPTPDITADEVLIKIRHTAICGTDLHIYDWDEWAQKTISTPLIIGHEFMGEIVAVGNNVHHLHPGDRVSGEGHIACGHCRNCSNGHAHICAHTIGTGIQRQGCFAQYFALPAKNVIALPAEISDEMGAILDPLGNAVHTAFSFPVVGENILITGAGPIGIMATALCIKAGAHQVVVTDVNPLRLQMAQQFGATRTVNIAEESLSEVMQKLAITEGFDVGLEMSGHPQAFQQMLTAVRNGAHIACLGILPDDMIVPWSKIIFKGLTIKGIYGREMFETWYKMLSLLQSGLSVEKLITHHFSYTEYEKAFATVKAGLAGKVILDW